MVSKAEEKLAGADGGDEILEEGAGKGEGDAIDGDGDEQQRHNNNISSNG